MDRGEIVVGEEVDGDADVIAVCVCRDSVCLVNRQEVQTPTGLFAARHV